MKRINFLYLMLTLPACVFAADTNSGAETRQIRVLSREKTDTLLKCVAETLEGAGKRVKAVGYDPNQITWGYDAFVYPCLDDKYVLCLTPDTQRLCMKNKAITPVEHFILRHAAHTACLGRIPEEEVDRVKNYISGVGVGSLIAGTAIGLSVGSLPVVYTGAALSTAAILGRLGLEFTTWPEHRLAARSVARACEQFKDAELVTVYKDYNEMHPRPSDLSKAPQTIKLLKAQVEKRHEV